MKHEHPLIDLDAAKYQLHCGVEVLGAIHAALEKGDCTPESYADAVFGGYDYLRTLTGEISECIEDCFKQQRAEKEAQA